MTPGAVLKLKVGLNAGRDAADRLHLLVDLFEHFLGILIGVRMRPIKDSMHVEDVCLIVSDRPSRGAAVFTQNAFCAAPVVVSRENVENGDYVPVALSVAIERP